MKNLYKQLLLNSPKIRNSMYSLLYRFDKVTKRESKIVILCYHGIGDTSWRYGISLADLKKQISYLKKHQYSFITLSDLSLYLMSKKELPNKSVLVTIDDGYSELVDTVEYFKKQHISPALFLLANTKNPNRQELANEKSFLKAKDIQLLKKYGWEFGSHSATHANLTTLTKKALQTEIIESKQLLEKQTEYPITAFAYPRGKYNKTVLEQVKKAGYTLGLTMDDGFINTKTNTLLIPRVGIDNTHTIREFPMLFSPSVINFRKMIKQSFLGEYL